MKPMANNFALAVVLSGPSVCAQQWLEHSAEHRLQLDLRFPDAALAKFLPPD
jgi:hypothetical protein